MAEKNMKPSKYTRVAHVQIMSGGSQEDLEEVEEALEDTPYEIHTMEDIKGINVLKEVD